MDPNTQELILTGAGGAVIAFLLGFGMHQPWQDCPACAACPEPEPLPPMEQFVDATEMVPAEIQAIIVTAPPTPQEVPAVTPTFWPEGRAEPRGYPWIGGGCCNPPTTPVCEFPWWCR